MSGSRFDLDDAGYRVQRSGLTTRQAVMVDVNGLPLARRPRWAGQWLREDATRMGVPLTARPVVMDGTIRGVRGAGTPEARYEVKLADRTCVVVPVDRVMPFEAMVGRRVWSGYPAMSGTRLHDLRLTRVSHVRGATLYDGASALASVKWVDW